MAKEMEKKRVRKIRRRPRRVLQPKEQGWVKWAAMQLECSRRTIQRALYEESRGSKSRAVWELYRKTHGCIPQRRKTITLNL